jgi:hypothetical protein
MGNGDECAPDASATLLSVALQGMPLEAGAGLELPLQWWAFPLEAFPSGEPALQGSELIVRGGPLPGARLTVDISDPDAPTVLRYQSAD